ncbi:FBXW5-like protein [Mya arenaria]|uniref:FBXW5-like protein n=1 Tax=Mya arenaria TaxID=6604 RepID=A0ABY7DTD6_MYAAR|nr:FBXW5-like protein [Mya arenaria]
MFSTTSKDASLKVWEMGYPTSLKYSRNFAEQLGWDFTQFSAFNESDTLVLVSSVKTVSIMDRRGYMAVLSLIDDFAILQVVTMDPSQLFGAWMDDSTFLGGSLQISLDRFATTVQIEAHKVKDTRGSGSEWEGTPDDSSGIPLFNFSSETASLIKFLTVSTVVPSLNQSEGADIETTHESEPMVYDTDSSPLICLTQKEVEDTDGDSMSRKNTSMYSSYKKQCHHLKQASASLDRENVNLKCKHDKEQLHCDLCKKHDADSNMDIEQEGLDKNVSSGAGLSDCRKHKVKYCSICDNASKEKLKNLIYVTGEFAVALHQLGFKNISPLHGGGSSSSSQPFGEDGELGEDRAGYDMVVNYSNNDVHWLEQPHPADTPDHLIDLHGHVTGLCLSADHRYLFINCRPWVGTVDLADPWLTPELSPNIEVRIIDLVSLLDLGVFYRGHQGFSPSNMCCFVFLDVSKDFVSSLLGTLPHTDGVVNATAFSPINQEYLVTASDDHTLKVWRSRAEVRRLGIQVPEEIHRRDNTELDKVTNKSPENRNIPLESCQAS